MKKTFTKLAVIISTVLVTFGLAGFASAWGPERPTYTNESPAPYATFNSITNNAAVGDERNFVRIGEADSTAPYTDEIEIVPGKEYEVYIYFHNDAASNTNASGYGIATNTKVSSAYPTKLNSGERGMVSGIISWSYVTPESPNDAKTGTVWDEAYLTTKSDNVVLRYKTGTAVIHNGGAANGSVLSTDLFTEGGTLIGYNKLAGTIPGCAEYSGYITYTLIAEKIDASLNKKVSNDGENWSESVTVKPGDYVTYKIEFKNTGNTKLTNVIFKDTHDNGLNLRPGSTKVFDVNNVDGKLIGDIIDLSGYNTGDVAAGALIQIIYQSQVSNNTDYCDKTLHNTITANYNSNLSKEDDASVIVKCDKETPEPTPGPEPTPEPTPGPESTPEPEPSPEPEPETPEEIVTTGPVEITLAIIILLGIGGGGYYFYRTRKTLKTVENKVSGNQDGGSLPKS